MSTSPGAGRLTTLHRPWTEKIRLDPTTSNQRAAPADPCHRRGAGDLDAVRDELRERQAVECLLEMGRGRAERCGSALGQLPTKIAVADDWYHKLRTEYHSRYALACSCFFFVLLGSPFAILMAKNQASTSFHACFGLIAGGYYRADAGPDDAVQVRESSTRAGRCGLAMELWRAAVVACPAKGAPALISVPLDRMAVEHWD